MGAASPGALLLRVSGGAALLPHSVSPRPRAVFRSWKPFLMSASRASMTHTSSGLPPPFLPEKPRGPSGMLPTGALGPTQAAWSGEGPQWAAQQGFWGGTLKPKGGPPRPGLPSQLPHGPLLTGRAILAPRPPRLLPCQLLLPLLGLHRLLLPVLVLLRGADTGPVTPCPPSLDWLRLALRRGPACPPVACPPSGRG